MSFILDALQRSERERSEADSLQAPALPRVGRAGGRRAFGAAIAALLLLNGVALGAWGLWRAAADTVAATTPNPPHAVPAASGPRAEPQLSTLALAAAARRDVPAASSTGGTNDSPTKRRETTPTAETVANPEGPPAPKPDADRSKAAPPKKAAVENPAAPAKVPFLEELPATFRAEVPAFEVNIHVYAEERERRFVLVDMKRYQAGDTLASGPRLEAVTADGLVLSWKGRRFRTLAR